MSSASMQAEHPAHELRQDLETYIVQKEISSKSFITKKSIERCWPEDLLQLDRKLGLSWGDTTLLAILSKECRVVACILAWIKHDKFSEILRAACNDVQDARLGQKNAILKDSLLILGEERCVKLFGFQAGQLFYQCQFMFCPILISSTVSGIYEVEPERRWPYANSPAEIGFGAYGRVYKVAVAKGQLQVTKDSSNDKEEYVAVKRVERPDAWRKEVKTLDFLKGSLSGHKRLLLHIAAFIQGPEFLIFLPYTPYGDLETFLREGTWQDDNSEDSVVYDFAKAFKSFSRSDLAREFAAVIDATGFLHERVSSAKGLPVYCAHVDLRTKNILVFPGDEKHPAGVWHISDFGISSIKLEDGQALPEPVWSKYPSMGDIVEGRWAPTGEQSVHKKLVGPHVAPEMSIHGIFMPKESDMWSLGCIFAEILVFGLGTQQPGNRKRELDEFRRERRSRIGSDRDDYFYDRELTAAPENEEILVTISRRPKVDEWLTYLHNQCGELYRNLAPTLDDMLQPDPRIRSLCTAKSASESVHKACKSSKSQLHKTDAPALTARKLEAKSWKFLALKQVAAANSVDRLFFLRHHESTDDGAQQTPKPLESIRSFPLQRSQTVVTIRGPNRVWEEVAPRQFKIVAWDVSSTYAVLVQLCQKQENPSPKPFFTTRKGSRKEAYELQFRKEAESASSSEAYSPYSLPPSVKWCKLRVVGKHAFVLGPGTESSTEHQIHIFDFVAGAEVKVPDSGEWSKLHKYTSSGSEILAAYDEKGFGLWQSDHKILKDNLSPKLGSSGQVTFGDDGLFLFTWSMPVLETEKIQIWSMEPSGEIKVCASYLVPRLSYRPKFEPLLLPCGSLPACIIRTKQGIWFTASKGSDIPPERELVMTEQNDMGASLPEGSTLCTANERCLFFLCDKGDVCICDLVWDSDTELRLVRKPNALAKSLLKNPHSIALHARADDKYDLIITNREGAVESIEVEC